MTHSIVARPLGWVVVNGDRERISPVLPTKKAASDWALKTLTRRQPGKRRCMSCRQRFDSEGIHDRLCPRCGHNANDAGLVEAVSRSSASDRSRRSVHF